MKTKVLPGQIVGRPVIQGLPVPGTIMVGQAVTICMLMLETFRQAEQKQLRLIVLPVVKFFTTMEQQQL